MKKLICIIFIGIVAVAGTLLARTNGPQPKGALFKSTSYPFYLDGIRYDSILQLSNILASPPWTPADPLPVSTDKVVEIARAELRKLGMTGGVESE